MTAIDELRGISGIIVESDIEVLMYKAILELAEEGAGTDGFAHAVADWAENAQDRCGKLEERVKALEDAKIFVDYGTGSQCKYCGTAEYPKGSGRGAHHSASCPVVQAQEKLTKPAPAPDLDALVEKYFGQLTKATFDINVPVMQAFKDILRAFAADLGYKP